MNRRTRRRGVYVVVEGIDGSGKSRLTRSLAASLRRRGWSVAVRREPHDRTLGALAQATSPRDPWTGGVYFTLDRILAHRELERDLRTHDVVVSDRSFYSTLAYQGSALPATRARRLARLQSTATTVPVVPPRGPVPLPEEFWSVRRTQVVDPSTVPKLPVCEPLGPESR